jgi:hypothetical protein
MTPARAEAEPSHAEIIARVGRHVTTCFDGLARAMVAGQNELRRDIRNLQKSVVLLERTVDERERASDKASAIVRKSLESRIEGAVGGAHDEIRHETGALHGRIDKLESRLTRPRPTAGSADDAAAGAALDGIARSVWTALRAWLAATIWGRIIAALLALAAALGGGMVIGSSAAAPASGAPPQGHPAAVVRVSIPPPPATRDASALGLRPDHG